MAVDVSVVIPTFRRNKELLAAIASVQSQEGVALEIIVVDDSPEGAARAPVEALGDPRITYLRTERPTGGVPSVVRNLGWRHAAGALVHFLDDDDMVPQGHYARVKMVFEQRPRIGLVFGRIAPFGDCPPDQLRGEEAFFADASRRARICRRIGTKRVFAGQMLFANPLLVCSASVMRRAAIARVGGFDPDIRLMEDADLHARVMRACGAAFIDEVTAHYRIGFPSLMHAPNPPPAQIEAQRAGRRRMQAKHRRDYGVLEFFALAAFTRLVTRQTPIVALMRRVRDMSCALVFGATCLSTVVDPIVEGPDPVIESPGRVDAVFLEPDPAESEDGTEQGGLTGEDRDEALRAVGGFPAGWRLRFYLNESGDVGAMIEHPDHTLPIYLIERDDGAVLVTRGNMVPVLDLEEHDSVVHALDSIRRDLQELGLATREGNIRPGGIT